MKEYVVTENMDSEDGFLDTVESREEAEEMLYKDEIDAYLLIKAESKEKAISKFYEKQDKVNK